MKTKHLFLILAIATIVVSCTRHCEKFPDNLKSYFPYEVGDTLTFVNQNGEQLLFFTRVMNFSKEHDYTWNCKCVCDIYSYFEIVELDTEVLISGGLSVDMTSHENSIDLNVNQFSFGWFFPDHKSSPLDTITMEAFNRTGYITDNYFDRLKIIKGKVL
ncbi:hypothetical protein FACS1894201_11870 [Bacteroidia bacterium]|nr:hypothetical protein FACS1894201_11870 [Bacteroidia bacterium]